MPNPISVTVYDPSPSDPRILAALAARKLLGEVMRAVDIAEVESLTASDILVNAPINKVVDLNEVRAMRNFVRALASARQHVERLIGSIRRESLDHLVVFGEVRLRVVLKAYVSYYNQVRTHLTLEKDAPDFRGIRKIGCIASIPILGGLHHQYVLV